MNRSSRRNRSRRGAAAVEMALTMIVLLPLIYYTLFLEDLLAYHLNWQEAIVTSPWDAIPIDYANKESAATMSMRYNRVAYCDHSSTHDSFNAATDCDDDKHHKAMTAHQCWMGQGKQITCGREADVGADVQQDFADEFGAGGLVHCTARLNVSNWFIINRFATWGKDFIEPKRQKFSKEGGSKGTQADSKHEGSGYTVTTETGWVFGRQGEGGGSSDTGEEPGADGTEENSPPPSGGGNTDDYFGVVHDTWAVNRVGSFTNRAKISTHKIYERMSMYYDLGIVSDATDAAKQLGDDLKSDELIGDKALEEDANGDDVKSPEMSFMSGDHTRRSSDSPMDYSAGWPDDRQGDAYGAREDEYMGLPKNEW